MPSAKFLKIAKNIAKEDKPMFDSLIEFEKTHKVRTKEKLNFTIDKTVALKFKKVCREKGFNMSAKVEQALRRVIDGKDC